MYSELPNNVLVNLVITIAYLSLLCSIFAAGYISGQSRQKKKDIARVKKIVDYYNRYTDGELAIVLWDDDDADFEDEGIYR